MTGVVDGTVVPAEPVEPLGPADTVRLTAVPAAKVVPAEGFVPMTAPAANVVLDANVMVPTPNPASPSVIAAWACARPTTFGTATDLLEIEVVVVEAALDVDRWAVGRRKKNPKATRTTAAAISAITFGSGNVITRCRRCARISCGASSHGVASARSYILRTS